MVVASGAQQPLSICCPSPQTQALSDLVLPVDTHAPQQSHTESAPPVNTTPESASGADATPMPESTCSVKVPPVHRSAVRTSADGLNRGSVQSSVCLPCTPATNLHRHFCRLLLPACPPSSSVSILKPPGHLPEGFCLLCHPSGQLGHCCSPHQYFSSFTSPSLRSPTPVTGLHS